MSSHNFAAYKSWLRCGDDRFGKHVRLTVLVELIFANCRVRAWLGWYGNTAQILQILRTYCTQRPFETFPQHELFGKRTERIHETLIEWVTCEYLEDFSSQRKQFLGASLSCLVVLWVEQCYEDGTYRPTTFRYGGHGPANYEPIMEKWIRNGADVHALMITSLYRDLSLLKYILIYFESLFDSASLANRWLSLLQRSGIEPAFSGVHSYTMAVQEPIPAYRSRRMFA
jgi:hypothetical protein